jgi:hypothetical protein
MALSAARADCRALWAAGDRRLQRLVTLGAWRARRIAADRPPVHRCRRSHPGAHLRPEFVAAGTALSIPCTASWNAATGSVATLLIMTGNGVRAGLGIAVGIALNVGLALVLIPTYGVTGAAIAAAVSLLASNLIHVVMARSSLGLDSTALGFFARRTG